MNTLNSFLSDIEDLDIFSYEDYKNSSLELKLKKIRLLNKYYKLKYGDLDKLRIYIDCDGVILDTLQYCIPMLLEQHNIDYSTHDRSIEEQDKIVEQFFSNLDWNVILHNATKINGSIDFIKLMQNSSLYYPIIYSAVTSDEEAIQKRIFFEEQTPGIDCKLIQSKNPKQCDDDKSILIDDDDFNLTHWQGRPLHFGSSRLSIYPSIEDLGEIYYLFLRDENNPKEFIITHRIYDEYEKVEDAHTKKIKWTKK
ncbi:MAG: hypothetical protein IJK66_05910 [Bacilli bacterium]|nr:hypothetical protein [Bacilli bacterium]